MLAIAWHQLPRIFNFIFWALMFLSLADRGNAGAPTITSLTLTNQACALYQLIKVQTNEVATCHYCLASVSCDDNTDFDDMTPMSITTDTVNHEVKPSQPCSSTASYKIKCQNVQEETSAATTVNIITDAAKSISLSGSLTISIGKGNLTIQILPQ
jgi:hypothetical protein